MSDLQLQFVFQGGGAKLGALVAAAEAVDSQRHTFGYTIKTVSGTSAGAIVACMLASGRMGEFRERLRGIAERHVKKIVRKDPWFVWGWRLWSGKPLYDVDAYKSFLIELFTLSNKKFEYLRDLSEPCDVLIHAVDIKDRQPLLYSKSSNGNVKIVDALFDSSALPYIFRTYRNESAIFDGGLINNFPSANLKADKKSGDVVGFSFERQPSIETNFTNVSEFSTAIISTMIDNATLTAVEKLQTGNVHCIKTQRNTLYFYGAIKEDLSGNNYENAINESIVFLRGVCADIRSRHLATSPDKFIDQVVELHNTISLRQKIHASDIFITHTSNSLLQNNRNADDVREIVIDFTPTDVPLLTYGMRLFAATELRGNIKAFDMDDNELATTTLLVSREHDRERDGVFSDNVIVIFNTVLDVGKKYRLVIIANANEILYDLVDSKKTYKDQIAFRGTKFANVDKVTFIAYIPHYMKVQLTDIVSDKRPKSVEWKPGSQLNLSASRLVRLPEPRFQAIGWQTEDLKNGVATGFAVQKL
jgi:predicted acylesterase/phospholipase RssA